MSNLSSTATATESLYHASDPLGEALHFLQMKGVIYTRSELSAPWGVSLPPIAGCLIFHVVLSGEAWLEVAGSETRRLRPGHFALVPHGAGHQLLSAPGVPVPDLFDLPREQVSPRFEILRHGGGGDVTHLVCGAVGFDHPAAHQLVQLLPPIIHIDEWQSPQMAWIQSTLRLMAAEAGAPQPGGEAVITRLADILVIQAIRTWMAQAPSARTGWLGALQDEQIGRAMVGMQRDPARAWTVESLAATVAMSRSAFAARFKALVGVSPMQYLTQWRMNLAVTWLREKEGTLGEIADRLGYQSEVAFGHAFKRVMGVSPGSLRRAAADP